MSYGYRFKDFVVRGSAPTVANATADVSNVIPVSSQDSLYINVRVVVSSVTAGSGIVAYLYDSFDGSTWEAVGSRGQVSITGDGTFEMAMVIY